MTTGLLGDWKAVVPSPQKKSTALPQHLGPHLVVQENPDAELAEIALAVFAFHCRHKKSAHLRALSSTWSRAGRPRQTEPLTRAWQR
jgi:hypothetical protein